MVNATKTQCIFIGSRQLCSCMSEHVVVNYDDTNISPSTHVKNLALYVDRFMSFDNQKKKKKYVCRFISIKYFFFILFIIVIIYLFILFCILTYRTYRLTGGLRWPTPTCLWRRQDYEYLLFF